MRAKHDADPTSLVGRFWRWHINFCPGWKAYFNSLPDSGKEEIRKKYNFCPCHVLHDVPPYRRQIL